MIGQFNCSPYHQIKNYEVNKDVIYSIAYISCFHAQGVTIELGTNNVQIGTTIMGANHHNATYLFAHYNEDISRFRFYGGLLARVNNNPTLGLFRVGVDTKIYGALYGTLSLSQITENVNYANFGLKLIL